MAAVIESRRGRDPKNVKKKKKFAGRMKSGGE